MPDDTLSITEVLESYADSLAQLGHGRSTYAEILKHGRAYEAAPLPSTIRRGPKKECFINALRITDNDELTYCEGYGLRASVGMPIHHAWCVTPNGVVVDPTWDDPEECQYFGIELYSGWVISLGWTGLALESFLSEKIREEEEDASNAGAST